MKARAICEMVARLKHETVASPNGTNSEANSQQGTLDTPFPFLGVMVKAAKDSPIVAVGVMVSIAAIVVGAVMSLAVGFGIFLFNLNGTMHEIKVHQETLIEQVAKIEKRQDDAGTAMRAYEAANGRYTEFLVGMMSPRQQQQANEYMRTHPIPKAIPKENQ